jgi:hypothetical protein
VPDDTDRSPRDSDRSPRDSAKSEAVAAEQIERRRQEVGHGGDVPYLCECEDPTCTQTIRLSPEEYARVRQSPRAFLIAPGHSTTSARILEQNRRFWIAVKEGDAGEVAGEH